MENIYRKEVGWTENDRYWSMENLQEAQSIPSINPINLNYFGKEQCEPGYLFGPFVRTNYILHMVRSGRGTLTKQGQTFRIGPGQTFLIYPGEETIYQADQTDPWYYMWIGFHGFRSEEMMRRAGFSPDSPVLTCRNMDRICETMEELLQYSELNYANELFRMGAMYHLLALIAENGAQVMPQIPSDGTPDQLYVKKAVNLLINSKESTVKVSDVADAVGISRSYLTSLFKREMKVSPQEFLMNFRMERAGDLLRHTSWSVGEIAEEIGYADTMSFSKAFKNHFHITPSQFRVLKPELVSLTVKGQFNGGRL
ncbi:MAG: helix-turn-helix domain-containing protein [Lachnospiraceae bacterium]|nr:helix-turn-helix domain-containing protein [Lachnospiraceae bacterium]